MGWGDVAGWFFNWLPRKGERLRNEIAKTQKEMDELVDKKEKWTLRDIAKYGRLADKLQLLEQKIANRTE